MKKKTVEIHTDDKYIAGESARAREIMDMKNIRRCQQAYTAPQELAYYRRTINVTSSYTNVQKLLRTRRIVFFIFFSDLRC